MAETAKTTEVKPVASGRTNAHSKRPRSHNAQPSRHAGILSLQSAAGNQATSHLLHANDGGPSVSQIPPIIQSTLSGGGGHPLDSVTRVEMESRFGQDFSQVRVHTDAEAAQSARAVNAVAYTVGADVVFDHGEYVPDTIAGKRLLAHELAHVVQQSRGGTAPPPLSNTPSSSSPLEQSADHVESAFTAGNSAIEVSGASAPGLSLKPRFPSRPVEKMEDPELEALIKEVAQWLKDNPVGTQENAQYQELLDAMKSEYESRKKISSSQKDLLTLPSGTVIPVEKDASQQPVPPPKPTSTEERIKSQLPWEQDKKKDTGPPIPPKPKGEMALPITLKFGGKDVVVAPSTATGERARLIHNLMVDFKLLEGNASAGRDAATAFLSEWLVIRKTADFIGQATPPALSFWDEVLDSVKKGREAVKNSDLEEARRLLELGLKQLRQVQSMWSYYKNKNMEGAESLKKGLEHTRNASFMTLAILATVASGGAASSAWLAAGKGAAGWIAFGAPVAAELGEMGLEAATGDKIDWGQHSVNIIAAIAAQLLGRFGGQAMGRCFNSLLTNPATKEAVKKLSRIVVENIIKTTVLHINSTFLTTAIQDAYKKYKGQAITWDQFREHVIAQLTNPMGLAMAAMSAAVGSYAEHRAQVAPSPQPPAGAPAASQQSSKQSGAGSGKPPAEPIKHESAASTDESSKVPTETGTPPVKAAAKAQAAVRDDLAARRSAGSTKRMPQVSPNAEKVSPIQKPLAPPQQKREESASAGGDKTEASKPLPPPIDLAARRAAGPGKRTPTVSAKAEKVTDLPVKKQPPPKPAAQESVEEIPVTKDKAVGAYEEYTGIGPSKRPDTTVASTGNSGSPKKPTLVSVGANPNVGKSTAQGAAGPPPPVAASSKAPAQKPAVPGPASKPVPNDRIPFSIKKRVFDLVTKHKANTAEMERLQVNIDEKNKQIKKYAEQQKTEQANKAAAARDKAQSKKNALKSENDEIKEELGQIKSRLFPDQNPPLPKSPQEAGRLQEKIVTDLTGWPKNTKEHRTAFGNREPDYLVTKDKAGRWVTAKTPEEASFVADSKHFGDTTVRLTDQIKGFIEIAGRTNPPTGQRYLILVTNATAKISSEVFSWASARGVTVKQIRQFRMK